MSTWHDTVRTSSRCEVHCVCTASNNLLRGEREIGCKEFIGMGDSAADCESALFWHESSFKESLKINDFMLDCKSTLSC